MSFIQIIAIVSIFFTIGSAVIEINFKQTNRAFRQLVLMLMYFVLVVFSIFIGEDGYVLVIAGSIGTVNLLKRYVNQPVIIKGDPQAREREYR